MISPARHLDAVDPLRSHRSLFVGAELPLVYLDGNSLGRPLARTPQRYADFVREQWGARLIRGWDEGWYDLPLTLGDEIAAACLGAAPGQTVVGDSTTVLLYKALRAAVALRPGRTEIVVDTDNFPTDRYLAEGVAAECGLTLRWIDVERTAGVSPEQMADVVSERTAVVLLSHVAYRSAWLADAPALTALAHDVGALIVWDLSHSVGSVPLALDQWGADFAVGCSYKYLNGGPGAPAFAYVAARHLGSFAQPIQGWMGTRDPFLMGPGYTPADGVRRMISGTPPVLGMLAMRDMVALLGEVGMEAVRAKSVALTTYVIERAGEWLPEVQIASPTNAERRGGHVTLNHPRMREVTTALWAREVIPDYRDPHGLRLGLSPLTTSFDEVERGLVAIREELRAAVRS